MQRIVVTGSESTGKTTLAHELSAWLGVPCVDEYSRRYAVQKGSPLDGDDVDAIARGQMVAEDDVLATAASSGHQLIVLDTDLLSTVVYARHYYGAVADWILAEARRRRGDLYLLCAIDIPWSADGVRDRPESRAELHALFRAALREFAVSWVPVEGRGPLRLQSAIAAVRGWRSAEAREAP
jgi:NadR type nicotinamide-nucleotide adenylyltransferase